MFGQWGQVFCLLVLGLLSCHRKTGQEHANLIGQKDLFEQYIIGITYLEGMPDVPVEEKVAYYNKLVDITGVSAASAQRYSERYFNHPEKWVKVIRTIVADGNYLPSNRKE